MKPGQCAFVSERLVTPTGVRPGACVVEGGRIKELLDRLPASFTGEIIECGPTALLPGLVDSHVHVNEPGRTDWEGFTTATQAAAAGGITTLVDMPLNCTPVTTSAASFAEKRRALAGKLWVDVGFWGGVTPESLDDLPALLESGVLGVKSFLIDSGIPDFRPMPAEQLPRAMRELARAGLPYLFHAELEAPTTPARADTYAEFLRSRPPEWENAAISLLITLAGQTRCRTHIVHLSSASALTEIARARNAGIPISAETCPHYLCLEAETIEASPNPSPLFKCCPPIRGGENQAALWRGLLQGTLELIVSDHSPCTPALKGLDQPEPSLRAAWGGISSLQFGLPLIWSQADARGFGLADIARWMCEGPARLAGLATRKGALRPGLDADFTLFDTENRRALNDAEILYRNKFSPYAGKSVRGRVLRTYLRGELVYDSTRTGEPVPTAPGPRGIELLAPRRLPELKRS